jgi:hypothetical protein
MGSSGMLRSVVLLCSVRRLLVAASVVPSSPILVTLMKEALGSSETSVPAEPHAVTSQKTPFFKIKLDHILTWYFSTTQPIYKMK